jgi:hypothetical protein
MDGSLALALGELFFVSKPVLAGFKPVLELGTLQSDKGSI